MWESEDLKCHEGRFYGLYRAYVYDNKDPKNMGRIRVCCPSVYGVDENDVPLVSDWAYPKFPIGLQCIPPTRNKDNSHVLVWIEFEMGDPNKPVWSGCPVSRGGLQVDVYHNHLSKVDGETSACVYSFSSPKGNKVILDDENNMISIVSKGGQSIEIDDDAGIISINGHIFRKE